ncbi:MAG: leucine-rich repeat domain-containing protein [Candidatus Izemoplasmatales bacterium]|nr:leucine-rich repeat domain-containing protein [Candidatus Izemoplasmatales bacterium]
MTIPEGITMICNDAFRSLPWTNVTLPSTLITIGTGVFTFNSNLSVVNIPANVSSIGQQTFSSCTGLRTITVDLENDYFTSVDGVLFNDDITTLVAYPPANVMTTYTVPASVTTIAAYAFSGMRVLQSLVFQNGLATINYYSISNSSSLQTVYIPLSVTNVVYSAIFNCTNLTIRVAASEKPVGWDNNWNSSSRPVIWGYVD